MRTLTCGATCHVHELIVRSSAGVLQIADADTTPLTACPRQRQALHTRTRHRDDHHIIPRRSQSHLGEGGGGGGVGGALSAWYSAVVHVHLDIMYTLK